MWTYFKTEVDKRPDFIAIVVALLQDAPVIFKQYLLVSSVVHSSGIIGTEVKGPQNYG